MAWFVVIVVVVLVLGAVAAAISDARDRRSGHDPSMRVEHIREHRKAVKAQRAKARGRRLGWSGPLDEHDARADRGPTGY